MKAIRRSPATLRRLYSSSSSSSRSGEKLTIGIRREDPQRIWERRCPLTPEDVSKLVEQENVRVLVQPCERRVWTLNELLQAGAEVHPTLSPAHIVVGIKETPLQEVLTDPVSLSSRPVPRTHLMFSHTHKGQHYNMELLSKFLANPGDAPQSTHPRLIDYELLTDEDGKRTVGFGWFAGVAGALESLSALAHSLLEIGVASPFLSTPRPHTHPSLPSLLKSLQTLVGDRIASEGTPTVLGPIVIGVTGTGKVTQGCLDLLEKLPTQLVSVEDLPRLVKDPNTDLHKIYVVHATAKDYFVRADGQPYSRDHYYSNPDVYSSVFHERIAPYLTLFLNGVGWANGYPRLMSTAQLTSTLTAAAQLGPGRFSCIGDISCDIHGGLEFMPRASTLSDPFFSIRPESVPKQLPPVTIMSVDILPTALSREASVHFSKVVLPYLKTLVREYRGDQSVREDQGEKKRVGALERATVARDGVLREDHKWLEGPLGTWRTQVAQEKEKAAAQSSAASAGAVPKKRILMLGSGMVAGPAIDEIARHGDVELLVASNSLTEAERLTTHHQNASARLIDMSKKEDVARLIEQSDIVVSLLPVPFHPSVAELCVKYRKHLVTASYISPEMRALHDSAQSADVLLLNEIGLDPGIDHCSAISLLSDLRASNKRVVSFTSFCGGLPAPENAEGVPLRYKFSWSPRGVLGAALNGAKFKLGGKVQQIEGKDILKDHFHNLPISDVLKLEGIANRDSLPYADTYALGSIDSLRTLVRGTLRFPGFSSVMHAFKNLGFLETTAKINLGSWSDFTRASIETKLDKKVPIDAPSLRSAIADLVDGDSMQDTVDALHYFGIIPGSSAATSLPPLPSQPTAPIDLLAILLAHTLRYAPIERDLVLLHHEITALNPSDNTPETHYSSLVAYGDDKASAMARCVGLPLAFAVRAVADGRVSMRGVQGPGAEKAVWGSVLIELGRVGLGMREGVKIGRGGVEGRLEEAMARR